MAKVPHSASKTRKKRRWTTEEKRNRNQKSSKLFTLDKSKIRQFNARVLHVAEKCSSNGKGVKILKSSVDLKDQGEESNSVGGVAIRTVSSSLIETLKQDGFILPPLPELVTIVAKPLLICDINGVLCHRVRADPYPDVPYRECTKKVSGTPVIPRPGIGDFLDLLTHHFCLAIWTSAKTQSAQSLLRAIIPDHLQSQIIFVWSQSQCDVQPHDNTVEMIDERSAVFVKSLNKVYSRFPLWNSSNTILIDDSREKIPTSDAGNVLHPPPMNGKQSSDKLSKYGIMDDLENHKKQMKFFASLADKLDSRDVQDQFTGKFSISALLDDPSSAEHMNWHKGARKSSRLLPTTSA